MLCSLLFPVLASVVAAASSSASASADPCSFSTTVTAVADVAAINACPTLSGDITVTGNQLVNVDLSKVKSINANVKVFNSSSINSVSLASVANVTGSLAFSALTQLRNVDFSSLTLAQQLSFVSLPSLATLRLGSGLATVSSLTLSDTALTTIDNLLQFSTIDVLNVNNNKNISSIDLSGLQSVTQGLTLSFNNDKATVKLPNLQWASNLTLQDIRDVSISNLKYVNGSFILAYNSFDHISFDSLTNVGTSLQVFANDNLEDLNMNNLTEVDGEFHIFNNTYLSDFELNNLQLVKGAFNMKGDFGNFTLPSLREVDGDFTVFSTSNKFSCKPFNKLHDSNKIKGHNYNCSSPYATLSSVASSSTAKASSSAKTSSAATSTGSSSSAAATASSTATSTKKSDATNASPAMVLTGAIAAVLALLV
ncbi:hypothetical protein JCM33374_g1720 [Metschnikowia sp. JCM 33374]|nr:hypothetical protein JCM33374_g1720 [Metschnikowia sp. JCM 33374]